MGNAHLGDYIAIVDGKFGRRTYEALTSFQERHGFAPDGILSQWELRVLVVEAIEEVDRLGFQFLVDGATEQELGIPTALVPIQQETKTGTRWFNRFGSLEIETISIPIYEASFEHLFARLSANTSRRSVTYKALKSSYFIVSGFVDGRGFYLRMERARGATKGFSMSWVPDGTNRHSQLAVAMSNSLNVSPPITGDHRRLGDAEKRQTEDPQPERSVATMGSGYFVSRYGHVVTNLHVVEGCNFVSVPGHGNARVLKTDRYLDLAVLQVSSEFARAYAQLRLKPPKRGETVYVMGYPLANVLADNLTITRGIVSSLAGFDGDILHFQISASVQPGNSGGPVIDESGNVIGTVVSRLDDLAFLEATGAVPQNVNFAIRGAFLTALMASVGIVIDYSEAADELKPEQIADRADDFTVQVLCDPNRQAKAAASPPLGTPSLNEAPDLSSAEANDVFIRQLEEAV